MLSFDFTYGLSISLSIINHQSTYLNRFLKIFIYLFLERGEGREKERERINVWLPVTRPQLGTWPATQACVLTGNRTGDLWFHRPALNPLSHTIQGSRVFIRMFEVLCISELINLFFHGFQLFSFWICERSLIVSFMFIYDFTYLVFRLRLISQLHQFYLLNDPSLSEELFIRQIPRSHTLILLFSKCWWDTERKSQTIWPCSHTCKP